MQHEKSARFIVMTLAALSVAFLAFGQGIRFPNTDVSEITAQDTDAALWIWADKYVYTPGETLTLQATLKTNGDT